MSAWQFIPVTVLAATCLVRARRNPAFWLGIPMVVALGRSLFFDLYTLGIPMPGGAYALGMEDVLFLVLCACVVPILWRRPDPKAAAPYWAAVAMPLALLLWFVVEYAVGIVGRPEVALRTALGVVKYAYVPLAAMLWLVGLRRVTLAEFMPVVRFVSWVCVVSGVLYILNAMGLQSYARVFTPYLASQEGGLAVVRDYLTYPVWQPLALGFLMGDGIAGRARVLSTCGALVLVMTAVFSYTRVFILASVVAVVFVLVMVALRGRAAGQTGRALAVLAGAAAAIGAIAWQVAPLSLQYVWTRLGGLTGGQLDANAMLRANLWVRAVQHATGVDSLVGAGFDPSLLNALRGIYFLDNWWATVLVLFGWIGVALFAAWFVAFGWNVSRVVVRALAPIPLQGAAVAAFCGTVFYSVAGASMFSVTAAAVFPFSLAAVAHANAWLPDQPPHVDDAARGITAPGWWLRLPRGVRAGTAAAAVTFLGVIVGRCVAGA